MWNENNVKAALPDVEILRTRRNSRSCIRARITGRRHRFARVYAIDDTGQATGEVYEFSWAAIVRSLNTNMPLLA